MDLKLVKNLLEVYDDILSYYKGDIKDKDIFYMYNRTIKELEEHYKEKRSELLER